MSDSHLGFQTAGKHPSASEVCEYNKENAYTNPMILLHSGSESKYVKMK